MNTNNFLIGIGLFVCVGAIVLVALVAFAVRALSRSRTNTPSTTDVWNNRGTEKPHYNDPNIESQGGFGGVPSTGPDRPPQGGVIGSSGFGGAQTYNTDENPGQARRSHDSDDISSSGGFGDR